jgi:hypothetical protein
MRPADLEDALQSTPFIPFDVRVDGKAIPVGHPEQVLLNKSKAVAVIVPDDHIHIVNVEHISALTLRLRKRNAA